jgi:hypothetical protein
VSDNASVAKTYNATSSLVCFENKNIFFYFEKTLWPTYFNAGVVVVNFEGEGLAPEPNPTIVSYYFKNALA